MLQNLLLEEYFAQKLVKGLNVSCLYLISIVKTGTNKFGHASIDHNEVLSSVGFDSRDSVDKAASICDERSPRLDDEFKVSREDQLANLKTKHQPRNQPNMTTKFHYSERSEE